MSAHPEPREKADASEISWRDLNYDIGWEATPGGVIRCRAVLNRRSDIFQAVEGLNLRAIFCASRGQTAFDLLRAGGNIRHIAVRLPKFFGPGHLYLTGRGLSDDAFVGTFSAVDPTLDDVLNGQSALLSHVSQARHREERYRREAEIQLQGLRALLAQSTAAEKLDALSALMMDAIAGASHLILRIGRDGRFRALSAEGPSVPDRGELAQILSGQQSLVTLYRDADPETAKLRRLLGARNGDVALIFLPVASESIALLCRPRRPEGFRPQDIDFAGRFALILKQALILKEEQEKLVQSAKLSALGQMSASLAHELRQPLNTISMAAQNLELLAEAGPVPPASLAQKIARILEQVERASRIMDRIRRFSRKGGGVFAPVDFVQLAQSVRLLVEPALTTASTKLLIDIEAGLTAACDAIRIEQLLVNLVCNANDALGGIGSDHVTAKGVITIRGHRTETGIALRVSDNGPGFPADVASRPLETFFTTKSAEKGTGLGLSICHMIAREHAGTLQFGNHAEGAYVELRLPDRSP